MEKLWEYPRILILIKYLHSSFNIYSISDYCDGCKIVISNSVIPSMFVSWCLFYYKGLLFPFFFFNITIYLSVSQTTDLSKWLYSTNISVLTLSYLVSGSEPIQAGLCTLSLMFASFLLSDTSCHRFLFTFLPQSWLSPRSFNSF